MTRTKKIASTIFEIISEAPSFFSTVFSRKSFYEKSFMLEFGFKPWEINRTFKRFESSQYIKNKNGKFYLTQKGLTKINYYKLKNIKLNMSRKWDKKWRLIIFDIPEKIKFIRDALRGKLKEWKCYQVQNSVFICPFSCEKEMMVINRVLTTEPYVHVFLVNNSEFKEEKIKRYYNL